uniref:Peptidase M13 N-terminal domain-containing protein n=1 Tax=Photinus pyralis TaxID=7054 RepID=A0A1Y1L7Y0_PHOPY
MDQKKSIFAKEPWWKRRSKLEKKLVLSLLGIVIAFIIFIALVCVKYVIPERPCHSSHCLLAASQVIGSIDTTVDPCDDFFTFACGKFIEQIHGDIEATSIKALEEKVARQVAELIKEPIKEDDHPFVKIQKQLFQNCMNETEEEQENALNIFNETIRELQGWPVVEGFEWDEQLFDWKRAIYQLRRKGLPYAIFFDVQVMPCLVNKTRNAVYLSEPFVIRVEEEHKESYKRYMVEAAVAMGAEEKLAIVELEKVFDLIDRVHKIVKENDRPNNYTMADVKRELLKERYTIDEYQKRHEALDWLSFINGILKPAGKLTKSDYVYFPTEKFVESLLSLLDKTPRRIQANYIMWNVLDSTITYLNKKLQQIENNYLCVADRSLQSNDRYKFCKRVINRTFRPSPVYINYARKYLPVEKRNKVKEMLTNIKGEFTELLKQSSWLDAESKEKALEKAQSMTGVIGTPGDYFNDDIYDTFKMEPKFAEDVTESNFFEIMLQNARHQVDLSFARIHKPNDDAYNDIVYHRAVATVNAMYSPSDNAMVLPVAILQGIFYDQDRPQYLNYGALGSIIGHEITHGFCKDASTFDKDGNEVESVWSNATAEAFERQIQCIIQDAEDFDVEDTEATINGTLTLEENIADYTGVKVAYAAYKNWVRVHGEEPQLTGVGYTPYQLFWVSSISHECYQLSGKSLEQSLKRDSHALNVYRATAPIRNSAEFAKDFNCPLNSKMNPPDKCQIF